MYSPSTNLRSVVRRWLKGLIHSTGYELFNTRKHYACDGLFTLHNDHFRSDPQFRAAYARGVEASAGIDPHFEWRIHIALWAAGIAARLPGDFVECGVNAGFISSSIMQRLDWSNAGKQFYLIDTFEGPVFEQFSSDELHRGRAELARAALGAGSYVTDMDRVNRNFSQWGNVQIVRGRVPDVLPTLDFGQVAFLHIDMNCAFPEREALLFFWDHIPHGGVVLLDDYAYFGHNTQAEALDDVARHLGTEILSLPTGQGLILK